MEKYFRYIKSWDDRLFPREKIYARQLSVPVQLTIIMGITAAFSIIGYMIPDDGFIAYDWFNYFRVDRIPWFYPPWTHYVVRYLNLPILIGLTVAAVGLAVLKRSVHTMSALFAFLTLPLFWTLFLGQLDGLVVLGLVGLPWFAPLVLIKPQVSLFAFLGRRSFLFAFGIVVGVSLLLWGPWLFELMPDWNVISNGFPNVISIGWWGLPLALPLLWWSRGDMDMLMAGGIFATPYLVPYNLLPLVPAISRLGPRSAAIASVLSWLPLSANWIGPAGWWLGWLFVAWIWICLAKQRYDWKFFSS